MPSHGSLLALGLLAVSACVDVSGSDGPPNEDTSPAPAPAPTPVEPELVWTHANACDSGSPMSLTAADGTGLKLESMHAQAVLDGPLALTELHLSFKNPQPRQIEGRFSIQLPPEAAISRFAMKIDERWQEGEVVERQAARRAYEDFLHRRQDPALMEKDAGNVFRARVFPIPANGTKELIVSYSQELERSDTPYRLPLCGLPELGNLDVDVMVRKSGSTATSSLGGDASVIEHVTVSKTDFAPTQDLEVQLKGGSHGLRFGELAIARVTPQLETDAPPLDNLTIIFDTSASRALDFTGQLDRLRRLIAALDEQSGHKLNVLVVAADQTDETIYEGLASRFGQAHIDRLQQRGAYGASNLARTLEHLQSRQALSPRILLISDGVVTAGDTDPVNLRTSITNLSHLGVQRFDALVDGGIQDAEQLKHLTTAGLPADGVVLDARMDMDSLVRRLSRSTRSGIPVKVPGATWVWPQTLDGIQPGDQVLVYARLPEDQPMAVDLGDVSIAEQPIHLSTAIGPLMQRAHAKAEIDALTEQISETTDAGERTKLIERVVERSTSQRVVSDYTALLVLETENDYQRYGIERRGLADILTVGPSGVQVLNRKSNTPPVHQDPKPQPPFQKKSKAESATEVDAYKSVGGNEAPGDVSDFDDEADREEKEEQDIEGDVRGNKASSSSVRSARLRLEESRSNNDMVPVADEEPMEVATPEPEPAADSTAREDGGPALEPPPAPTPRRNTVNTPQQQAVVPVDHPVPWEGSFKTVMEALKRGDQTTAKNVATAWQTENPGDVLALVALGEVAEAEGDFERAARIYGSIIDLFPSRADMRRMAGERLERLGTTALDLMLDTYKTAVEQRPDHPSGHRLYAFALARAGRYQEAFDVIDQALSRSYPYNRGSVTRRALLEDLGVLGAVLMTRDPKRSQAIQSRLAAHGQALETAPSLRFILVWETDANDVDFHIYDAKGGHAFYADRQLPSGGELFDDVTTGYGPEQFAIDRPSAFPYRLQAHYYSRGPMGYGMGAVQIMEHDGAGDLRFRTEPFVNMIDGGYVELGRVNEPLNAAKKSQ